MNHPSVWTLNNGECPSGDRQAMTKCFLEDVERDRLSMHSPMAVHSGANNVRIVTWNVHMWTDAYGKANCDDFVHALQSLDADVFCLQEVVDDVWTRRMFFSLGYACLVLPNDLGEKADDKADDKNNEANSDRIIMKNAIAWRPKRLSIRDFDYLAYPSRAGDEVRGMLSVTFRFASAALRHLPEFTVATTHLDVHDNSGQTRSRQAAILHERLQSRPNVILVGDLNSYSYTHPWIENDDKKRGIPSNAHKHGIHTLRKREWQSAFDVLGSREPAYTVWSARTVDYILLRNFGSYAPLRLQHAQVVARTESDHLPLLADFVITR